MKKALASQTLTWSLPCVNYKLKALSQVILMLKTVENNPAMKIPPSLHKSRNSSGYTIIKA